MCVCAAADKHGKFKVLHETNHESRPLYDITVSVLTAALSFIAVTENRKQNQHRRK